MWGSGIRRRTTRIVADMSLVVANAKRWALNNRSKAEKASKSGMKFVLLTVAGMAVVGAATWAWAPIRDLFVAGGSPVSIRFAGDVTTQYWRQDPIAGQLPPCATDQYHEFMQENGAVPANNQSVILEVLAERDVTLNITGLDVRVESRENVGGGTVYECPYGDNPGTEWYVDVDLDAPGRGTSFYRYEGNDLVKDRAVVVRMMKGQSVFLHLTPSGSQEMVAWATTVRMQANGERLEVTPDGNNFHNAFSGPDATLITVAA